MAKDDNLKTVALIGGVGLLVYLATRNGEDGIPSLPGIGGINLTNMPSFPSFPAIPEIPGIDDIESACNLGNLPGLNLSNINLPGLPNIDLGLPDVLIMPDPLKITQKTTPLTHLQIGQEGFMVVPQIMGVNEPTTSWWQRLLKDMGNLAPLSGGTPLAGIASGIYKWIKYGSPVVDYIPDTEYFAEPEALPIPETLIPQFIPAGQEQGEREELAEPERVSSCPSCIVGTGIGAGANVVPSAKVTQPEPEVKAAQVTIVQVPEIPRPFRVF